MTAIQWIGAMVGVFVAAIAYDFAYARYVAAAARHAAGAAAGWSAATYAVGLIGFAAVLRGSMWLAAPEAVGLALGTWLGVRRR